MDQPERPENDDHNAQKDDQFNCFPQEGGRPDPEESGSDSFTTAEEEVADGAEASTMPQDEVEQEDAGPSTEPPKRKRKPKDYGILERDDWTGNWWWASSEASPWEPATLFTNEVRRDFLEEMGRLGRFAHYRPTGSGIYDQTSYHPGQRTWGPDRQDRPDILFQYQKREKSKEERQAQKNPGFLYHRDRIVIAPDPIPYRPILNYPEIPKTLSSAEKGWSLEAMSRLNEFIRLEDFRDRMPFDNRPDIKSLSMRRSRYRWSSGSLAWTTREGSKAIEEYLNKLIPKQLLLANTTRGFRDLTDDEVEAMKLASKGKYPERGRRENRSNEGEGEAAEAGPSNKREQKKKKAKSRSHSRSRSRSPRPESNRQRHRTRTPEIEGSGKGKAVAQDSEPEDLQAHHPEQPEEPYDWRDAEPQTREELQIIHYALIETRWHIYDLTGGEPTPRTDQHASYNEQWTVLHNHLVMVWTAHGHDEMGAVPGLIKQGPWYGDGLPRCFLDWQGLEPEYLE